jgi:hypothetical protein
MASEADKTQLETSQEFTGSENNDNTTSKSSSDSGDAVKAVTHSVSWITYQVRDSTLVETASLTASRSSSQLLWADISMASAPTPLLEHWLSLPSSPSSCRRQMPLNEPMASSEGEFFVNTREKCADFV